jgi:two-component system response regulator NreC
MSITILLADDHVVVRQGLTYLLSAQPDFQVVGEVGDGLAAIEAVDRLRPQVVLLDLMMPGMNGLEVTRKIHQKVRVVVLSMHNNEAYVSEALRNGAFGYVLKDATAEELVCAVRTVAGGKLYLSRPFSEKSIEAFLKRTTTAALDPMDTLTGRERQVLQYTAQGLSAPDIAERLVISPRTVEVHRASVMRKLGLKSQAEVIRFAITRGIVIAES